MRVTYTLSDAAVWNDGTPITAADFECTWLANANTPASYATIGYDRIIAVSEGETPQEVYVDFASVFAAWRTLFAPMNEASQHEDCNDVSTDFNGVHTYGGVQPYAMTEWTPEQIVLEKNPGYKGSKVVKTDRIIIVPAEDGSTLLKAGAVDVIFPQFFAGIEDELADPNVATDRESGGSYEALYFQQDDACTPDETRSCAFADDTFRAAFSKSIDLPAVYDQIYAPFAAGSPLLECGPIAPGDYCDPVFTDTYDAAGAETLLTDAGWTKVDGLWTNADGEAPEIHWMINTGNSRRESTQEFLIPKMKEAGFNVIADNCEAIPCVFETRLPAEKYDLAMYISTVAPDPIYITSGFTCAQVPSEANDFKGANNFGWCNEEASAALEQADATVDTAERIVLVKKALALMASDYALLPTLQFPNIGAYRSDRVAGTQNNLANYNGIADLYNYEDLDGDGQVVSGAEQFPVPDCANIVTSCASSTWFVWMASFNQFPATYETTNDQHFIPGEMLAGEATVEVF